MNKDKLRVLLVAEAANPEWVSVPLEGWSHTRAIARHVDAHVVTHSRNRDAFLRSGLTEGKDFSIINNEAIAGPVSSAADFLRGGDGRGWTTVMAARALAYGSFERLVWKAFASKICRGEFDIVHRVTPLSPTIPSRMAKWCRQADVPFVLGPLNGGLPWPKPFRAARRSEGEWLSYVRGLHKLMPGYRSTRQNASAIIVGSKATFSQIANRYRDKCIYIPENGIDPSRFPERAPRTCSEVPLRVAFVGRLVPYKGPDILIDALTPLLRGGKVVLDVLGDGPLRQRLQEQVDTLGVNDAVQLHGFVPQPELIRVLDHCHVLAMPSGREFGGAAVIEAMAVGIVPIVLDYGGPGELVTDQTGIAVPMAERHELQEAIRESLDDLCLHPEKIESMSRHAMQRAHHNFSWDAKAMQVVEVYRWVLGLRDEKPDFGVPLP